MADNAGKLEKLSRLRSLRSGLRARGAPDDHEEIDPLGTLMEGEGKEGASRSPQPSDEAAPPPPAPAAVEAKAEDDDAESLSAYFEALGIVPDGAKKAGATGTPPKPYAPASGAYTNPADTGRDVDARDRWADPVREDDSYLSSFAGDPPVRSTEAPVAVEAAPFVEEPAPAVEAAAPVEAATGFDFEEAVSDPEVAVETTDEVPAESFGPPEAIDPDPSGFVLSHEDDEDGEPVSRDEEVGEADLPDDLPDDPPEDTQDDAGADFDRSIDIEAFEREIAMAESARRGEVAPSVEADTASPEPEPEIESEPGESLSITFDPDRAAMLKQVSDRMGCSVDDVVVTAIDWYLDALLDDEGGAEAEGSGA